MEYGLNKGLEQGLKADIDRFADLVASSEARSLMGLFFQMTELKKNPLAKAARPVSKA